MLGTGPHGKIGFRLMQVGTNQKWAYTYYLNGKAAITSSYLYEFGNQYSFFL